MSVTNLRRLLDQAPIPWARAVELVAAVCVAVDGARADGVEADLVPERVYLDERSRDHVEARMIDDGARGAFDAQPPESRNSADQLWASMAARATAEPRWNPYASPERLHRQTTESESDVYTLGVLAYELVTGRRPFPDARSALELRTAQLGPAPERASTIRPDLDLPLELDHVLARCLAVTPEDRVPGVRALARELAMVAHRRYLREGQSVRSLFEVPGDVRTRLERFGQVCRAAANGDALSFVVDDISPETLFLVGPRCVVSRPAPRPRRAREIGEERHDGPSEHALQYASPEQLMGRPRDLRSAVYSLGVIGYEGITGQRPFADARGPAGVITAQLKQPPRPPSAIAASPPAWDLLLLRCLEKQPEARYADLSALAAAVTELDAKSHG